MKPLTRISATLMSFALACSAYAAWPEKPIRIVVPTPPGNSSDVAMRILGEKLSAQFGQPVLVDNRPGAGGAIAMSFGAKQAANGYTLIMGSTGPMSIARWISATPLPYDAEKDFAPVAAVAWAPQVLTVRKDMPAANFREFVSLAKRPGEPMKYGTAGNGTTSHLVISKILQEISAKADHIPYQGGAQTLVELIGGQIDFISDNLPVMQASLQRGQVKALGVTSAERIPALPDVPTLKEQGLPAFDLQGWILVFAPAGTPDPIVKQLNEAIAGVLKMPDVRKRLLDIGLLPMNMPREQLADFVRSESNRWQEVVRISGAAQSAK
jgi:tripartite-type tricarboxylate transporter receptor subunit TctC